MRLYGHVAYRDSLPGPALCGKPSRRARKPALFYCGRCVTAMVEESQRRRDLYVVNMLLDEMGEDE